MDLIEQIFTPENGHKAVAVAYVVAVGCVLAILLSGN